MADQWNAKLEGWINDIKSTEIPRLNALSESEWTRSPKPGEWSVAQIVNHLVVSGKSGIEVIERGIKQAEEAGVKRVGLPKYGMSERMFIKLVSPNPPFKVPVPPMFQPAEAPPLEETRTAFIELQDAILELIRRSADWDLQKIRVASPANAHMKFGTAAYLEGMIQHQRYHCLQIDAALK